MAAQSSQSNVSKPVKTLVQDTIPDGGIVKISVQQDSLVFDETMLIFAHAANTRYLKGSDAIYFPGLGKANLASLSSDSVACAIKKMPYVTNAPIRLRVGAKTDGVYMLRVSYSKSIPKGINIWLKDSYLQDSLALRYWNYKFDIFKTDSSSYGSNRFTLVLR